MDARLLQRFSRRLTGVRPLARPAGRLALAAVAALALPAAEPPVVRAAAIVVNTLDGEGLADGLCSLPEAVLNANQNTASAADCAPGSGDVPDAITFAVDGVIVVPSNLIIIDPAGLVIDGAGRTVTITGTRPDSFVTPLFVQSIAEFRNVTIANSSGRGVVNQGTLLLDRVTLSGNQLGGLGNSGLLTVLNSTVSDNVAPSGAGVYNGNSATAVIANTTISGNVATVEGGGVQNLGGLTLINSTIAANSAPLGGGIGGPAMVRNSLLSNTADAGPDCSGAIIFTGPSLLASDAGCSPTGDAPIVADPLLGPLAANGGPTKTHALLAGSPARDAGSALICVTAPVSSLDQRGVARPQGAACDLGAYEATGAVSGGRNLSISTGSIDLQWEGGTLQTGYSLLRYNTSTTAASLIALPGSATSYHDAAAGDGVIYCYALAATGATGFLGLSDLECAMTGMQSGAIAPSDLRLAMNQTSSATLNWTTPAGGVDSYLLVVIPLDGTAPTNIPLAGAAVSAVQASSPAGTCFQLVAFSGASLGLSNVLCGMPGISTFGAASVTQASVLSEALRQVALSASLLHNRYLHP